MMTKTAQARLSLRRATWIMLFLLCSATVVTVESFGLQPPPPPFRTVSLWQLSASTSTTPTVTTTTSSSSSPSSSGNTKVFDHPVILFDGVCNFCNTWVDILLRLDTKGVYKLTPLQSELGKSLLQSIGKDANDISSIVLIETDGKTYYTKSDCVLQVVSQLGRPFQLAMNVLKFTIPPFLRDTIYDTVSENRYNILGQRDVCRSGDPIYFDRFISE